MTTPTLPDRLLAEADFTRQLFPVAIGPDLAHLKARESMLREAAAALSVRVPEGDMARALEWLRGFGWVVPDTVKSAIEEAIAAYDPERSGAYSGKLSGREAVATVKHGTKLYITPQPGDGVCRAESARAFMGDGNPMVQVSYYWPVEGKLLRHTQFIGPFRTIEQAEQIVTLLLPAAPSAKGV